MTRRKNQRGSKDLHQATLSIRMKGMMTTGNVESDFDITSGARGEIVGIVRPGEPEQNQETIVRLKYLSAYIACTCFHVRGTWTRG